MSDNVDQLVSSGSFWGDSADRIFPRSERFGFFDTILRRPDWTDKRILDIGGNRGNLLEDGVSIGTIDPENYYSFDVDNNALDYGKQNYPNANWIHHNAFNHMYNASGADNTPFPFDDNFFDFVFAYSVYSHTTLEQLEFDLSEMHRVCKIGGRIAFTVVDIDSLDFFINKRKADYPGKRVVSRHDFIEMQEYKYFVDNDLILDHMFSKKPVEHLITVYNLNWLSNKLIELGFEHKIKFPPTGHIQRTVIIEKQG